MTCHERIPLWLFRGTHKRWKSSGVRYGSSLSDESLSTEAVQHRVAAERCRREEEFEAQIAGESGELKRNKSS